MNCAFATHATCHSLANLAAAAAGATPVWFSATYSSALSLIPNIQPYTDTPTTTSQHLSTKCSPRAYAMLLPWQQSLRHQQPENNCTVRQDDSLADRLFIIAQDIGNTTPVTSTAMCATGWDTPPCQASMHATRSYQGTVTYPSCQAMANTAKGFCVAHALSHQCSTLHSCDHLTRSHPQGKTRAPKLGWQLCKTANATPSTQHSLRTLHCGVHNSSLPAAAVPAAHTPGSATTRPISVANRGLLPKLRAKQVARGQPVPLFP